MTSQDSCPTDLSTLDYGLGWFLIVGTVVSYVPQHIKIIMDGTHMGLSCSSLSFGNLAAFGSLLNYLAIEYSSTFECCGAGVSFLDCSGAYLAFGQLISIYACQHLVLILFVIYYDHEFEKDKESSPGANYRYVKIFCWVQFFIQTLAGGLLLTFDLIWGTDSDPTYIIGVVMMGFTSIVGAWQMVPQIIETYKLRTLGSLSVITLLLQSFGSLLTAYNLSTHGSWEVWTPFLIIALLQFVLILQGWYYFYEAHGCSYCVCKISRKEGKLKMDVQIQHGTSAPGYEEEVVSSSMASGEGGGGEGEKENDKRTTKSLHSGRGGSRIDSEDDQGIQPYERLQ